VGPPRNGLWDGGAAGSLTLDSYLGRANCRCSAQTCVLVISLSPNDGNVGALPDLLDLTPKRLLPPAPLARGVRLSRARQKLNIKAGKRL